MYGTKCCPGFQNRTIFQVTRGRWFLQSGFRFRANLRCSHAVLYKVALIFALSYTWHSKSRSQFTSMIDLANHCFQVSDTQDLRNVSMDTLRMSYENNREAENLLIWATVCMAGNFPSHMNNMTHFSWHFHYVQCTWQLSSECSQMRATMWWLRRA